MYKRTGQNEREAALRSYFAKRPQRTVPTIALVLMGMGGLLLVVFLASLGEASDPLGESSNSLGKEQGAILLFIAGFAGGGWLLYSREEKSFQLRLQEYEGLPSPPSDDLVDTWFEEGIAKVTEHSRCSLHLDVAERAFSEPLRIISPILAKEPGIDPWDLTWRYGAKDRKLRFGVYRVTIIWLTDRHLAYYTCFYDLIRDVTVNETATEIHYCDVVSFATRETSSTYDTYSAVLPTGRKATVQQELILSVASGGAIQVTLEEAYVKNITGAEALPESGAEKAVTVVRTMLREKKRKESEMSLSSAA